MKTDLHSHAKPNSKGSDHLPTTNEVMERLDAPWTDDRDRAKSRLPGLIPDRVGRYVVKRLLGHGSFGIVCLARDDLLDRDVAIKLPRPEVLANRDRLQRFTTEAKAAASLDHSGIVPLYEANLDGDLPFIASAYCDGPDLAQWLELNTAPVNWKDAALLIAELAKAVHYAHERGVLHHDLKPSNVMLIPRDGQEHMQDGLQRFLPRLTDFGLAKMTEMSIEDTRSSLLLGTPLYMAPESFSNPSNELESADIYSLGCILYELLTGCVPIKGDTYAEVIDRLRETVPQKLRKMRADVPSALEAICTKCLRKDPAARYQTALDLANDLNACLEGNPIHVQSQGWLDKLLYWSIQPKRIRDAGLFAIGFHAMSFLWLSLCSLILTQSDLLTTEQLRANVAEQIIVNLAFDLPFILLGWHTIQRRRLAIGIGLFMSILQAVLSLVFITGVITPFQDVYQDADYHRAANLTLILLCCFTQLFLYVSAFNAARIQKP